ncbi:swi5-like zinc finger protein [Mortierella alpina]|nr:swi5-like zinc finger protein [Mortierella alpina]
METSEDPSRHHAAQDTMSRDPSLIPTPPSPQDHRPTTHNDSAVPAEDSDQKSDLKKTDDPDDRSRESLPSADEPSEVKGEESGSPDPEGASCSGAAPQSTPHTVASTAASHERHVKKRESKEQYDMMKAREDAKIAQLKATIQELERQEQELLHSIRGEGTPSEIIDRHIKELHRYNEIKDAGQIILGKCAEIEGTTIKEQYEKYGLDVED